MSILRTEGQPCPIDEVALRMAVCQPCRFFRGASSGGMPCVWSITCNWPRSGSFIDRSPIPEAFRKAFDDDGVPA